MSRGKSGKRNRKRAIHNRQVVAINGRSWEFREGIKEWNYNNRETIKPTRGNK